MNNTLNIDLDINNYDYLELLKIFGLLQLDNHSNTIMEEKLSLVKKNFSQNVYSFFKNAYKILSFLYLLNDHGILDMRETKEIDR